jgi:ankyrin repeat protein
MLLLLSVTCFIQQAGAESTKTQSAHVTLVDVLLKYGMNSTPPAINQAMEAKDYEAVKLLIEHGADLNTRGKKTSISCVLPMMQWDKTNIRDLFSEGETVLEVAIKRRKKSLIKQLLSAGADPYTNRRIGYILYDSPPKDKFYFGLREKSTGNRVDEVNQQINAMYEIVNAGDLEILTIFAETGIDFNKQCLPYDKPLKIAHQLKNKEVMQFLLDHGAEI